ncbi:MAG: hypothetical protein ACKPA7_30995 [Sphaerospermopsis kisseleviana]
MRIREIPVTFSNIDTKPVRIRLVKNNSIDMSTDFSNHLGAFSANVFLTRYKMGTTIKLTQPAIVAHTILRTVVRKVIRLPKNKIKNQLIPFKVPIIPKITRAVIPPKIALRIDMTT